MKIENAQYVKNVLGDGKVNSIRCIINGEPDNFVPLSEENRHYVEIMKQVKAGTLTIKEAD